MFYCKDLGVELGPIIKGFFASDEYKTDKPGVNSVMPLPWAIDTTTSLPPPFDFNAWCQKNRRAGAGVKVFPGKTQMQTVVYSDGEFGIGCENGYQWIYQLVRKLNL